MWLQRKYYWASKVMFVFKAEYSSQKFVLCAAWLFLPAARRIKVVTTWTITAR